MTDPARQAAVAVLSTASLADIARDLPGSAVRNVQNILCAVRVHLSMDVAFVSEFVGKQRYFRNVDAKGRAPMAVGDATALQDSYCQRVVDGVLPQLIVDTGDDPIAASLPDTASVPIGSHMSVPIRLRDGRAYGTFCCFSFAPDYTLNERDLDVMRAFAEVAAAQIDYEFDRMATRAEKSGRITAAIEQKQPSMVYQPVVSLDDMHVVGLECLARFDFDPYRGPDLWFAEAADAGAGTLLELQAIRNGLDDLHARGIDELMRIWVNASAATVISGEIGANLQGVSPRRIVLELTEHDIVDDYAALERALQPLRAQGIGVAIDDAGAGYASMSHILHIAPDYIKLDISLTRHIDVDRKRRALAAALIEFGRQTEAEIVAEGVESIAELNELRRLGVRMAQGYFISEPIRGDRLVDALAMLKSRDDSVAH